MPFLSIKTVEGQKASHETEVGKRRRGEEENEVGYPRVPNFGLLLSSSPLAVPHAAGG
jgi:hypothetical protein